MHILIEAKAGSHLFGTNTVNSDLDIKGIYLPKKEDILLGTVKPSINIRTNNTNDKNKPEDIDKEYYSISKFLKMLQEGQTVAIELLFTPDNMVIQKDDELWSYFKDNKQKFLHSKISACIGYAKQQVNRYGLRGSNMGAIKATLELLNKYNECDKLGSIKDKLEELASREDKVDIVKIDVLKNGTPSKEDYLSVCGSRHGFSAKIGFIKDSLQKRYDTYGNRARLAADNQGIDWKACSHALRVLNQGIELLSTGNLVLPRPDAELLKKIKAGEVNFEEFQVLIDKKYEELNNAHKESSLPKKLEDEFVNDFICMFHEAIINEKTRYL